MPGTARHLLGLPYQHPDEPMKSPLLSVPQELRGPASHGWLTRLFSRLPRASTPENIDRHLVLMRTLGSPDNIRHLLTTILRDEEVLQAVASRSYRHTNHFDKIVLVDSGARLGYRLTLHFWDPPYSSSEVEDEQIHDHRFSFWSHVLAGRVVFQNYNRDASGTLHNEYQYIPERQGLATVGNYYVDVGQSPLLEVEGTIAESRETYYLPFSQIHRVVLRQELSCTLVLRGPRQKNYASVFTTRRKYDPSANAAFTRDQVRSRIERIRNTLPTDS